MRSGSIFDLARLKAELERLQRESESPEFWAEPARAQATMQQIARLRNQIEPVERLQAQAQEYSEWLSLLQMEYDEAMAGEIAARIAQLQHEVEQLELLTLLNGEYDRNNAILEINSGAGGTEACDWAEMLLRMYLRWAQRHGYRTEIVDESPGTVTGYSSVGVLIEGEYAYGKLKSEHGVHRLVRISPFDANKRRHTSFVLVEVMPQVEQTEYVLKPEELKIETFRAGGHGGQHVNKTESAVRITHLPTGITASCQNERSQHQNKEVAMRVLASRVAEYYRRLEEQKMRALKGEVAPAEWGHQIRSYVLQPYTLVKDHRTDYETGNVQAVLDGEIDGFIEAYLRWSASKRTPVETQG
ncbi:bacterial peptide chain release factor 2 (bRF-2) [Armatimonadetes bacterium DC]|nr:bacterial peptide chain release factor 2 (bRF-2) [Armatimonadetes bacterium DC]